MEEVTVIRQNPFCVISKAVFGEYAVRDIQTNVAWSQNPYGEEYAVVPDEMVQDILAACGFCDIELNDEGTEVVSFIARGIPEIPKPEAEPTNEDKIKDLEAENVVINEQLTMLDETAIALYEEVEAQTATNEAQDEALIELYEMAGL